MAMNQSCYALVGREGIAQQFLFLTIRESVEQLQQQAHGAVFDTIIVDTFRRLEIVKPPTVLIDQFCELVAPIFEQILNLLRKNETLRQARDLLLPRLVSGELTVEHMPDVDPALIEV
jgi:type I restriction enzyme S subunit